MKLPRRTFLHLAAGAAALPTVSRIARAQAYPTRPIRLVIPFPPGGAFDAVGRPLADKMKSLLGTMVVENVGGGGGSLGVAAVARAHPDGYTLVLGGTITHINEVLLKSRPQYDAVKDLDPVAGAAANVLCIAVHPSVPAQNLKEFVAYANANPGKLSYGHAGVGSIQHLAGELFKSLAGTPDIVQVPYRGTGPLITDVLAGQVQMGTPGVTGQVIELHRSSKMRVCRDQSDASCRCAGASDSSRTGVSGCDGDRFLGVARAGRNTQGDYRADRSGHTHRGRRTGLQADADRGGYRTHSRLKSRKIPAVACSRRCSVDAGCQSTRNKDRLNT